MLLRNEFEEIERLSDNLGAALELLHKAGRGETINYPMTSQMVERRAQRRREIADSIKRNGGKVNPDYD